MDAYLDIETSYEFEITVIGLFREDLGFRQLVGPEVNTENLLSLLNGVRRIVTYNGSRFDLPVIRKKMNVDLFDLCESYDLMYSCWKRKWLGGLKKVEKLLGLTRQSEGIDGNDAMRLWHLYEYYKDREALDSLLQYNREDVMNLVLLRERLEEKTEIE